MYLPALDCRHETVFALIKNLLGSSSIIALIAAPSIVNAQEFIWNPNTGDPEIGGSGVMDQGVTPNFSAVGSTARVVFPGGADIRFAEANPNGNDVTVEGTVNTTGLIFDASGYNISNGDAGALTTTPGGTLSLQFNNNAEAEISVEINGAARVDGAGTFILSGGQSELTELLVANGMTVTADAKNGRAEVTNFGSTTNTASLGAVINAGGTFENTAGSTVTFDVANQSGTAVLAGTVGGNVTNNATLDLQDGLVVSSSLNNQGGTATFDSGNQDVADSITNSATMNISSGSSVSTTTFTNQGDGTAVLLGELNGAATNFGLMRVFGDDATINGSMANTGIISLANNDFVGDVLTVNGSLFEDGVYQVDLNLFGEGSADTIVIDGGPVTGEVTFDFVTANVPTVATEQRILVFDVDASEENDFTFTSTGLPPANSISVYSLIEDEATQDLFVVGQINPGVGTVGANFVLTQSLIGAVISRPNSPYVTGLIYDDPDPCGPGIWTRYQNGVADASSQSGNGVSQVQTTLNADYVGFLAGGDFACFDNTGTGWDFAFGAIAGFNSGDISQPVFAIDPNDPTQVTDTLTSVTRSDFLQRYAALYTTATSGPWAIDVQYRREFTDFEVTNEGVDGMDGIGIEEEDIASTAGTFSGSASYAYAIPDTNFAVVPTVGFSTTRGSSGTADFEDGSDLKVGDFVSNIGFAGLTTAWSRVDATGRGVYNAFLTGTYYNDFSPDTISTFETPEGDAAALSNSSLGSFSEVSLGLNHIQVLSANSFLGAKQLSTNLRGDIRFGDQIDSWGLAGQVRVQF